MFEARLLHVRGDLRERADVRGLFFGDGEPAEPIALVRSGPERSILLPEARNFIVFFPVFEGRAHRARELIRQFVGLFVNAHARTPAFLPTASSRVLKASANSLTPSTIRLSVTSFMEIPALARSAMIFAAPSTFSVRLGRSLP